MIRRLIKVVLSRKRGDSLHWRRLYERERASRESDRAVWAAERQHLINQILIKNAAAPLMKDGIEQPKPERFYDEDELAVMAIAQQAGHLAEVAAVDEFEFEVAKLRAQSDPVWRPIVEEASKLRKEGVVS